MDASVERLGRRTLLRRAVLLGAAAAAGTAAYARWVEPRRLRTVWRDLPVANLPPALCGRRVVQVSDLHVGPRADLAYLARAMDAVAALAPDLVVVTGDVVEHRGSRDVESAQAVLARLPAPSLGTLAVLGNHDYGPGWQDEAAARRLAGALSEVGVHVLRNEVRDVAGMEVVGLDDLWAGRFAPACVLPRPDPARAAIVLCHNPDALDEPGWGGYRGWVLAGHTHGGQVKPPFLDPPLLPVRNPRYARGAVDLADGRRLYVNVGLGWLRPVRYNVPPEITVLTLVPS